MSKDEKKSSRISERPNLSEEREAFVKGVLHKGVEFTEELIHENQEMREELLRLESENARLRSQIASDDAIRDLLATVERLEQERTSLLDRSTELESHSRSVEDRHREVESELNDLASLYVASYQLNVSLSPRRVVKHICELLEQLVGCDAFGVYIVSSDGRTAEPVGGRRMPPGELRTEELTEGPMADVVLTAIPRVRDNPGESGVGAVAILPMTVSGTVIGLIKVLRLLPHKKDWAPVDQEFFKLLGIHASTALVAASLYGEDGAPRDAMAPLRKYFAEGELEDGIVKRDTGA